jgi:UPF0716 protein FxsA
MPQTSFPPSFELLTMPYPSRMVLLAAALALPLIELALLIKAGQILGFWPLLGIVVGTAIGGVMLLRGHGLRVLRRVHEAVEGGRMPLRAGVEGALVMLAAMLLISPGLLCDVAGLLLLVPWTRTALAGAVLASLGQAGTTARGPARTEAEARPPFTGEEGGTVIEGEFERLDERPIPERGGAPARRDVPRAGRTG